MSGSSCGSKPKTPKTELESWGKLPSNHLEFCPFILLSMIYPWSKIPATMPRPWWGATGTLATRFCLSRHWTRHLTGAVTPASRMSRGAASSVSSCAMLIHPRILTIGIQPIYGSIEDWIYMIFIIHWEEIWWILVMFIPICEFPRCEAWEKKSFEKMCWKSWMAGFGRPILWPPWWIRWSFGCHQTWLGNHGNQRKS